MSPSASTLLTPGEAMSWHVWKPRASSPAESVDTPADYASRAKGVIVGLPATACRTVGLILPQADHSLLEDMVAAQLEKRGIKGPNGSAPNFRFHVLGHAGPNAIISCDVLVEPFPEELAVASAANYAAALRLSHLPNGQLIIAEEQGELVIAAHHQGKLFHSHIFAQRPAEAASLAQEIMFTRLGLENPPGLSPVQGVTLVGQWDSDVVDALRHSGVGSVQVVEQLAPSTSLDTRSWSVLLPRSVSDGRLAAARRGRWIGIAFLAAAAYALIAAACVWNLKQLKTQSTEIAAELDEISAPAAEVRRTADRWAAMAPAIDVKRYPIVVLGEVTKLLPPSGINLRDFEVRTSGEIDIRAEARAQTTAALFVEDLKKHKTLGETHYDWDMPQPEVRDNKTVRCRITGKPKLKAHAQ